MHPKHKHFADEYLVDSNASRAYAAAGYSAKNADANAYLLLRRSDIKEYIEEAQKVICKKIQITRESLLDDLQEIKNNTMGTNPQAALKSIELQAKMLGLNEPTKTETKVVGDINLKDLLDFK